MNKIRNRQLTIGIYFGFWLLFLGITNFIIGCGQSTTPTTTTTLPRAATISGKLYAGTIRSSAVYSLATGVRIMSEADTPLANYTVVAIGTTDNKVYFPDAKTSAADGSFSISVPSGESYYLDIINDKGEFIAPVSFGAITNEVIMAVSPEAGSGAVNLGTITYQSAKGAAVPTAEVAVAQLDQNSLATKKIGESFVPVGTGLNLGRGTGEAHYVGTLQDKVDEDKDGLPDVIDIDDNGNGKVDGIDPDPRLSGRVEFKITGVNNAVSFANFTRIYQEYPTFKNNDWNTEPIDVATVTNLAIEAVMPAGTDPSYFSDVRVVDGPAWIQTATVVALSPPYPLWKDQNYQLTSASGRWDVHVIPNGTPEAGDVLRYRVTDTAGVSQEFISTITYLYHNIPRLIGYSYYDGATLVTKEGAANLDVALYQGNGNMFDYKGPTITFLWYPPKGDDGNYLWSMDSFLDGLVYTRADSSMFTTPSNKIIPTKIIDPVYGEIYSYTFTPTTDAFSYFKVDLKSQNPVSGGGNAAQLINFKKI